MSTWSWSAEHQQEKTGSQGSNIIEGGREVREEGVGVAEGEGEGVFTSHTNMVFYTWNKSGEDNRQESVSLLLLCQFWVASLYNGENDGLLGLCFYF